MKILVDFHHADLFEGHQLVFGDRFGWEVYAPYGMAWFDEWIWSFEREHHGDAVAQQYLMGIWQGAEPDTNGVVRVPDPRHPGRTLVGMTLEAAREAVFGMVMSTVPANANGFEKLARTQGAAFGIHVGNQWGEEAWETKPDFAIVTTTSPIPDGIPNVVVHQEFSMEDFRYIPPSPFFGPVRSFVNCFPEMTSEYRDNFLPTAKALPEFGWGVYGAYGTAPLDEYARENLSTTPAVAAAMRGAGAIWHAKHWSDGFGHVIHNAFAVGRPVFGYQRYYADKLAGPLWVEGETTFDVESKSTAEVGEILTRLRDDPGYHLRLCENAAARFREVVSFEEDAVAIRGLLDAVMSVAA